MTTVFSKTLSDSGRQLEFELLFTPAAKPDNYVLRLKCTQVVYDGAPFYEYSTIIDEIRITGEELLWITRVLGGPLPHTQSTALLGPEGAVARRLEIIGDFFMTFRLTVGEEVTRLRLFEPDKSMLLPIFRTCIEEMLAHQLTVTLT